MFSTERMEIKLIMEILKYIFIKFSDIYINVYIYTYINIYI